MKKILLFAFLCIFSQLYAKPKIDALAGISIGKPLDPEIKKKAQMLDKRNGHIPDMLQLEKLPDYKNIAGTPITLFVVHTNGGTVDSIEIRFNAKKGNRAAVFAWIKEQTNVDPTEFEDGRMNYSERSKDGYVKGMSLGSYVIGNEDREYSISLSNQKI